MIALPPYRQSNIFSKEASPLMPKSNGLNSACDYPSSASFSKY